MRATSSSGASGSWNSSRARPTSPDLLDRLANRLLDAGALPAGHGSKLARVLADAAGRRRRIRAAATRTDPIHRAVAEQVDQLVEWDRAVRADVYDSVHQMRVTTRKIRSLLQASEGAFGISDDAWVLDELRQLASVLGVARDAEVLAERYERRPGRTPRRTGARSDPERLVDGAKRRYKSGLRRSLIAMRSERYFRLLDALDGLVAAEPPSTGGGRGAGDRHHRLGLQAGAQSRQECGRRGRARTARGAAPNSQGRQAASLHRGRHRRRQGVRSGQDHSDACWVTIRTAWSAART